MKNFFKYYPENRNTAEEVFDTVFENKNVRIERIISSGQTTPEGTWLEQKGDEWVILLEGKAELSFEDTGEIISLVPGDYIYIKASRRHRVESTGKDMKTVWLAVHFGHQ